MKGEALKGHLDLLILATLEGGRAHGYSMIEALRARSRGAFDLPEGTVYPALHRLEQENLLASRWAEVGGRRRRVYSLTRKGRRALLHQRQGWRAFSTAVAAVVGGSP
jgi:DNA-binding PadR family transcriptional regulator